jgi:hypothetical protein
MKGVPTQKQGNVARPVKQKAGFAQISLGTELVFSLKGN